MALTAIIQARISSSRLPGKVLRLIQNKPMLYHVVNQTKQSKFIKRIIIATTNLPQDKKIVDFCKKNNLEYFRGSQRDVLDRYYKCAKKFGCDPIVRITSDCPLLDPKVIDRVIRKFRKNNFDYISNNVEKVNGKWKNSSCNYPQGMTVEISSFSTLQKAWKEAKKPSEREHVYPYIQFNPKLFKISSIKNTVDLSHIRCTVDKTQDFLFVREIFKRVPKKKTVVQINNILSIIKKEPQLLKLNSDIDFDEGYKISLLKDKKGF